MNVPLRSPLGDMPSAHGPPVLAARRASTSVSRVTHVVSEVDGGAVLGLAAGDLYDLAELAKVPREDGLVVVALGHLGAEE